MMLTCGRHARSRCSRHHITRLHTGFHVTVGVSDFRILRNVGETNHTQIQIQYRGIEVLHLHLHLQTLLRQVILQQLEELVVREVHHLLIVMLTRGRHARSRRHTRSTASTRSRGDHLAGRHHDQPALVATDDNLVRDVDELDRVHVVLQHRRVQPLLLHLHRQRLHVLARFLAPEPLDVPNIVHADHLRLAHVVHVQHVLVQALLHHLLLHHLHRHAAAPVVEEPRVLGDRAVVRKLLVQVRRVEPCRLRLLLQRVQRLAQHLQVEEAHVLRVDALLCVTPHRLAHEVQRGLEGLLAKRHQLPCEVLRVTAAHRTHRHALVEGHVEAVGCDAQHEVGHLQQQLPHPPAAVRVVGDGEHIAQDA